MLTLEQAKEIQRKRSKDCLLKFDGYVLLAVALWGVLFFFTDYLAKYGALYAVFPLLLLVGAKMSKLLAFLQKKEFIGKIVDGDIKMVTARRYGATNQPGTTHAASDMPILEITVENDVGKRVYKTTPYQWAWGEFKPGMQVCLLRFIDQPVRL